MHTTHLKLVPIAICLSFMFAACSDSTSSTATSDAVSTTAASSTTPATTAAPATPATTVPTATVPATSAPDTCVEEADSPDTFVLVHLCGAILTDAGGMTLYTFAPDVPGSDVSNCYDGCATTWPPVVIPEGDFLIVIPTDFAEMPRDDGLGQITYKGQPLYHYSGDIAPGDTNGDGIGGVWHTVPLD